MYLFEFYYCGKFYPSCGISPQIARGEIIRFYLMAVLILSLIWMMFAIWRIKIVLGEKN